jgi:hypothetical protein
VLLLDVPIIQKTVLPLDVPFIQKTVLPFDVSILLQIVLPLEVRSLQQPGLILGASILPALVAQCTGTGGAVCKGATPSVEQ